VTNFRTALRRGTVLSAVIALAAFMAACSTPSESGDDEGSTGGGTVAVADGAVELSAADLEFDASVIEATVGEAFTITFTNNESQPHNVAIYTEEGGDEIVKGNVIGEGETDEVAVEALEAGEYFFVCDVHPEMTGTVVVEG